MACRTGKTLTALFINEELAAESTLVLVPLLSLSAQTLREWTANTTVGFDFLPVCSDETVAEPDAVVAKHSSLVVRSAVRGPIRPQSGAIAHEHPRGESAALQFGARPECVGAGQHGERLSEFPRTYLRTVARRGVDS
jgi:hypothetical protein